MRPTTSLLDIFELLLHSYLSVALVRYRLLYGSKTGFFDAVEAEATGRGLKTVRMPLTFGLDVNTAIDTVAKARESPSNPLLLLVDKTDELAVCLSQGTCRNLGSDDERDCRGTPPDGRCWACYDRRRDRGAGRGKDGVSGAYVTMTNAQTRQ